MLILDDVVWNLANVALLFFQIDFFSKSLMLLCSGSIMISGASGICLSGAGLCPVIMDDFILVRQCVKYLLLLLVVVSLIRFGFHHNMQLICYSLSQNNNIVINCCFETAFPLILVLNNVVWNLANIVLPFSLIYVCCFFLHHSCNNTVEKL